MEFFESIRNNLKIISPLARHITIMEEVPQKQKFQLLLFYSVSIDKKIK